MVNANSFARICLLAALARASLHAESETQAPQLLETYDFVIAGGGTAGLTVADRLSEAFPTSMAYIKHM
jgi:choline dehydrogenase